MIRDDTVPVRRKVIKDRGCHVRPLGFPFDFSSVGRALFVLLSSPASK